MVGMSKASQLPWEIKNEEANLE